METKIKMSPEVQAQYEANRLRMADITTKLNRYFWLHLGLGAFLFASCFFAGAASTLHDNATGPWKFYAAMSAGMFQILFGIGHIVIGFLTSYTKKRLPSLILLGADVLAMIMILLSRNGTFAAANMILLVGGAASEVWAQMLFNSLAELKECPGYPHFALNEIPAEFQPSLLVTGRQAGTDMATIGDASAAPAASASHEMAPLPAPEAVCLDELTGAPDAPRPAAVQTPAPDIPLEQFTAEAAGKTAEPVLPTVSAEELLSDMSAETATSVYKPDLNALPTPEEVRARLAAMKAERRGE